MQHAGSAEHETLYGRAAVSWRLEEGTLLVEVTVPTGSDATVELPGAEPVPVTSGTHRFEQAWPPASVG